MQALGTSSAKLTSAEETWRDELDRARSAQQQAESRARVAVAQAQVASARMREAEAEAEDARALMREPEAQPGTRDSRDIEARASRHSMQQP
eukprot:4328628-Prymnesium_polylepis.1